MIINYVNYVFTFLFLMLLFLGGVMQIDDANALSLYVAFFLGVFQLTIAVLTLIIWRRLEQDCRKYLMTYLSLVILYFVMWFVLAEFFRGLDKVVLIFLVPPPILLSVFFTYLLHKITLVL
ncbi:conserved membrane protein of unknown function [Tenacibaculum sp. 190130A14a]